MIFVSGAVSREKGSFVCHPALDAGSNLLPTTIPNCSKIRWNPFSTSGAKNRFTKHQHSFPIYVPSPFHSCPKLISCHLDPTVQLDPRVGSRTSSRNSQVGFLVQRFVCKLHRRLLSDGARSRVPVHGVCQPYLFQTSKTWHLAKG